ncbi:MAG TPA: hypothetical protein VL003_08220 [Pusillimonas sp.]|uniref:BPTD_2524 family lipoprotein n=1 Tax=Pusillimonas sp. TaxID=3040095 RepID=UPI002CFF1509|nr:hypothetical protein [Pusillimonas sp.]HUH88027.1 hypothetical protein [Pusillimonas sp.]
MKSWMAFSAVLLLAGCSLGIRSDGSSPSVTYTVPHSYQVVYMRAQHQANECQYGNSTYNVQSNIDSTMRTGVVSVTDPVLGIEVARTTLKSVDTQHTEVTQTVSGKGSWNQDVLNAMQQSVRMDASVCFVYK